MSPSQKAAIAAAPKDPPYIARLKRGTAKRLIDAPWLVTELIADLLEELAFEGPKQPEWPSFPCYRKTREVDIYRCRLLLQNPTYVAIWEVRGKNIELDVVFTGSSIKPEK